ncbi:MAG: DNRLRE domain-containing protein [Phycisphaeraceae bacterium]|nr:DNRLRE domain-containing protein [Phycisphaeraceae bacterium]
MRPRTEAITRSRHTVLPVAALLGVLLTAVGVARAETVDVYAYNNAFSLNPPGQPIAHPVITVGDTVRWVWLQGNHTTTSVAGSPETWNALLNSSSQTHAHTFTQVGLWWYYCIPHGSDNGDGTASGMSGTVTVLPAGPGACCLPGGACLVLAPAACLGDGGSYEGDGTSCMPDPCTVEPIVTVLVADRDNILYETVDGSISNAQGSSLYVGNQNSGARRRSVLRFDLGAIPQGAVVQSASLRLRCNQSSGAPFPVTLHRLLADWGEGTSQAGGNEGSGAPATAGDATWLHRFHPDLFWATAGGDFVSTTSASVTIASGNTLYTWTGGGMHADVQHWIDMPAMNHGWIMRGDEASSSNSKRLDSRHVATEANRPTLTVTWLPPAPGGACCFSDGTCEAMSEASCIDMAGVFQGTGTLCDRVACPIVLAKYVDALPRPAVAVPAVGVPGGPAHYEIAMTEQFQQLHRDLPPTRVWGYAGTYPGPTIEARRHQPVTVTWTNDLRVHETGELRTTHALTVDTCLHGPHHTGTVPVGIVHLHGGKVAPESDGYPELAFPPGQSSPVYTYPNDQPAATVWYHDHALGITRLNVMMGMAGFYLIRDDEEDALGLPSGEYEIAMAIQDRAFHPDGSLRYPDMWHEHFFGDVILVNGKVWPYLDVDRGLYRFRVVNGSNSRAYTLSLSDSASFRQIGTDLGLLEAPVTLTELTLLPGERADLIVDFSGYLPGTEIVLLNSAPAPFPGFPGVGVIPEVMKFIVQDAAGHTAPVPASLVTVPMLHEQDAVIERVLDLRTIPNIHCPDHHDQMWTIDGLLWDDITEFPVLGTTEIWTWRNDSGISHPMHMHLVMVQVLDRQAIDVNTGEPTGPRIPPAPNERGWKDTVNAPPGFFTRIITRFEGFTGLYPYHCHILEHEDHEMMRQFQVVAVPPVPGDINGDGTVDFADLLLVLSAWGPCPGDPHHDPCPADLTGDGTVDFADLLIVLANWG